MEKAVEHGADRCGIAQQLAPVVDRAVRGRQRTGSLVATHDDFEQFFGRREGQLAHAEVIDDEQRDGHQPLQAFSARAIQARFGEIIEQRVGLALEDAIPLLDDGLADGLGEVTFAGAGRA